MALPTRAGSVNMEHTSDIEPVDELTTLMNYIENIYFRTNSDTGSNHNSLFIWNILREHVGYPPLTADMLRQRQVDSSSRGNLTVESLRDFDEWYKMYSAYNGVGHQMHMKVEALGGRA